MSQPAARLGDMTAHGGVITLGFPTVLIGGQPAARVADMHVCPMFTGVVPHVGGVIAPPGAVTVLIGGMPAARVGDMTICAGPPGVIIPPGCPTVLIGSAGGGSGGSAGAAGAATGAGAGANEGNIDTNSAVGKLEEIVTSGLGGASATWGAEYLEALLNALKAQGQNKESATKAEHWIEFAFVDSAGLPVSRVSYEFTDTESNLSHGLLPGNGTIARDGIPAGQGKVVLKTVYNARWSKDMAKLGEVLTLTADVEGFPAGTPAIFLVYQRDVTGPPKVIATINSQTQGDKVETTWTFALPPEEADILVPEEGAPDTDVEPKGYSAPDFFFAVHVELCRALSGILYIEDFIEVEAVDEEDKPLADQEYALYLASGEVRQGVLDGSGKTREDKIPAGLTNLRFPTLPEVEFEGPETDGSAGSSGGSSSQGGSGGTTSKGGFDDGSSGGGGTTSKGGFDDGGSGGGGTGSKGGFDDGSSGGGTGSKGGFGDGGGGSKGGF